MHEEPTRLVARVCRSPVEKPRRAQRQSAPAAVEEVVVAEAACRWRRSVLLATSERPVHSPPAPTASARLAVSLQQVLRPLRMAAVAVAAPASSPFPPECWARRGHRPHREAANVPAPPRVRRPRVVHREQNRSRHSTPQRRHRQLPRRIRHSTRSLLRARRATICARRVREANRSPRRQAVGRRSCAALCTIRAAVIAHGSSSKRAVLPARSMALLRRSRCHTLTRRPWRWRSGGATRARGWSGR